MKNLLIAFTLSLCAHSLLIIGKAPLRMGPEFNYAQNLGESSFKMTIELLKESPSLQKQGKKAKRAKTENSRASHSSKEADLDRGTQKLIALYLKSVREAIIRSRVKTKLAKKLKLEGEVKLAFTIKRPNLVESIEILESSEISAIDKSAVLTVSNAKNIPEIPEKIEKDLLLVQLVISYKNNY